MPESELVCRYCTGQILCFFRIFPTPVQLAYFPVNSFQPTVSPAYFAVCIFFYIFGCILAVCAFYFFPPVSLLLMYFSFSSPASSMFVKFSFFHFLASHCCTNFSKRSLRLFSCVSRKPASDLHRQLSGYCVHWRALANQIMRGSSGRWIRCGDHHGNPPPFSRPGPLIRPCPIEDLPRSSKRRSI